MPDQSSPIAVVDFRRTRQVLEWNFLNGTWTACDTPPALVHGIAFIRPSQPNICVFGHAGQLTLQVGPDRFDFDAESPRISCSRAVASFGLRRNFRVASGEGSSLFSHNYWSHRGRDFFRWLAERSADRRWRTDSGPRWSEGVEADVMRPR